jgi:glycosyltransferase 2 family protein
LSIQDATSRPQTHRHWLALGFSFALTAVTLFFVFRGIDRAVFARLLATQDRGWLAVAALFFLTQIVFGGERWRSILRALMRGPPPAMASVQAVFYASIFFNCLPLGTVGGDVARIWLARRFALSMSQIVLSILIDRALTVAALIMLALATLPTIWSPFAAAIWFGGAAILVAGALAILLLGVIERVLGRWRRQRLIHFVLRMAEELRLLTKRSGLIALGFALASGTCSGVGAYCIARSLGIGVGPVAMIAVISIMTLVVALPISVAGWGVRELSLVALLGLLGVDREAALALSVELGVIGTLLSLPGGIVWLMLRDHRKAVSPANKAE